MSRFMMNAIDRVLIQELGTSELDDIGSGIDKLDDEKKIDLLDKLIEATMNYGAHFRGSGGSSPIVPQTPSNDQGQILAIPETQSGYSEAKESKGSGSN